MQNCICSGLPYYVRIFVISSTSGVAFFTALLYARRWLLHFLLTYRGWMCMYVYVLLQH